jgi:Mg-chelatase subunit ChlD
MDKNDRLALILFGSKASIYFDLDYMTDGKKQNLIKKIDEINASGGTDILSGLEKAVEILKKEKKTKMIIECLQLYYYQMDVTITKMIFNLEKL